MFINQLREIEMAVGESGKLVSENEMLGRAWACKSLVFARDHNVGDKIRNDSLQTKRPGTGVSPDREEEVIGKTLKISVRADSVLRWEHLQ